MSKYSRLERIVFGANSFQQARSLTLSNMNYLVSVVFKAGAFQNAYDCNIHHNPVLESVVYEGNNFNGESSSRRLDDSVSGLTVVSCSLVQEIIIPGTSFTRITVMTLVELPSLTSLVVSDGALPEVKIIQLVRVEKVERIVFGAGSLSGCEEVKMERVATTVVDITTVIEVKDGCLKSLQTISVSQVVQDRLLGEDLKDKLDKGDVDVVETIPTTMVPTVAPSTEAPTQPPTEAPTTQPPTTLPPTPIPPTEVPTTVPPTTLPPTEAPATLPPTTLPPTTQPPTTQPPTTQSPTQPPTTLPPTIPPTPSFPIYDPYILGDNCEIESQDTCYYDVIKDDDVTRYYLRIRDAYPTKALANTRVLALAGMTKLSLDLWHESLSKQTMSENPIDMYLYGDVLLSRMLDASMVPRLMELTKYTRPSRLHFVYGTFKREGFKTMLDWMVANRNKGYFVNLREFHVNEHNIQACVNPDDADSLQTDIIADLKIICEDTVNFPLLAEMNYDDNGYNEGGGIHDISPFAQAMMNACQETSRSVEISARSPYAGYTKMCGTLEDSYHYYDLSNPSEANKCRFTWHWELKTGYRQYGEKGPFPNRDNPRTDCPTRAPTTMPPTQPPATLPPTEAPTTQPPTTQPPTTVPPTTQPTTTVLPTIPPTEPPATLPPTVHPTTEAPTTQPTTQPTTLPPTTQPEAPSLDPTPTPTPTPTPEPWFPIYDPYILGDNCDIESQNTCYIDVVKDDAVTELYLKVRDYYPTKALAHTRVLALAGMTKLSLDLFHESLSKQRKNEAPIDTYIYGDVLLSHQIDASMIPRLVELTQYTRPSRLVFILGTFKREGFKQLLDYMIANANKGYFKNLKYFQVSEHNIQACVNRDDSETLQASILADLKAICEDKVNFPLLEEKPR